MFEDALVVGKSAGGRKRWIVLGSFAVQVCVVAGLVVVPLLWPEVLPIVNAAPRTVTMLKRVELKPQLRHETPRVSNETAVHLPASARTEAVATSTRPGAIARGALATAMESGPTLLAPGNGMGSFNMAASLGGPGGGGATVVAAAAPSHAGPMRISSGVVAGQLLAPITPVYPMLAKATHTSGAVVLRATIDRTGHITGLQVLSGPEMLRGAALEAVQVARYRPFVLNGETTEVETTITVVFSMGA